MIAAALERQIDELEYVLYDLTSEEIKIVEGTAARPGAVRSG